MALHQKLTAKLAQRLVMTPSLQQAIKLLQMSKLELVEEVQEELLENPVLEESVSEAAPGENSESETADNDGADEGSDFDEIDYDAYFQDYDEYRPRQAQEIGEALPTFEATLAETPNLSDHLTWQLDLSVHSERTKEIGRAIIGNLNPEGYLRATIEELQQMGGYGHEEVERVLKTIQRFDPIGVAARDLVECLTVQLEHLGEDGTAAEIIVRSHLDKLQRRQYKELAEALDLDMEDLQAELEVIRRLDPRPGLKYQSDRNNYVVPDVYVVRVEGDYKIMLNEEGLPKLRISPVYRRMIARGNREAGQDAKEYVRNKLRAALRLIKSLEERQRTIFKVATSIVKFQREFLDYGIEKMRPLVLKDVAEDIGMHESTVSRVVNNKYMHTHRGLFELRFFFHSGIASSRGGAAVSSLTVKDRIKKIIGDEDSKKPYSDASIVKMLAEDGLKIARRTVAKYREELKIPSSSVRRQAFP